MSILSAVTGSWWAYLAVFAVGAATSAVVVAPVATWKERAAWTAPLDDARKEAAARETAANDAAAQQAKDFTIAVAGVNARNAQTDAIIGDYIVTTQGIGNEIGKIERKIATLPAGNCSFSADVDSVRNDAYSAAVHPASSAAKGAKANGSNDAGNRPAAADKP